MPIVSGGVEKTKWATTTVLITQNTCVTHTYAKHAGWTRHFKGGTGTFNRLRLDRECKEMDRQGACEKALQIGARISTTSARSRLVRYKLLYKPWALSIKDGDFPPPL